MGFIQILIACFFNGYISQVILSGNAPFFLLFLLILSCPKMARSRHMLLTNLGSFYYGGHRRGPQTRLT